MTKLVKELKKVDRAVIDNREDILTFIQAGKAHFSLLSIKTNSELEFKISEFNELLFVHYRRIDKYETYQRRTRKYVGCIGRKGALVPLYKTKKSEASDDIWNGFSWFMRALLSNNMHQLEKVRFMHYGRCARCGKKLVTEQSVKSGMGPVCGNR